MTQEEKELLLKDLCCRLPYGVLCKLKNEILPLKDVLIDGVVGNKGQLGFGTCKYGRIFQEIDEIKPYLRPMSDMTEEEKKEYNAYHSHPDNIGDSPWFYVDWLNEHYFDYRGLIEKGLAIEVTNENNPYKS